MSALARLYSVLGLTVGRLSILPHPRGGDWLEDDLRALRIYEGVDVLVSLLTAGEAVELGLEEEKEIGQGQGLRFRSFPIGDLQTPPWSAEVLTLLEVLRAELAAGRHMAIHCRAGIGRSGLIAASVLVLSGWEPEEACRVLSLARGHTVPETAEQVAWVRTLPERLAESAGGPHDGP